MYILEFCILPVVSFVMFVLLAVLGKFHVFCIFLIKFSLVENQEAKTLGLNVVINISTEIYFIHSFLFSLSFLYVHDDNLSLIGQHLISVLFILLIIIY